MMAPNINPVTMFSAQASVMTAGKVSITPGMTSVNLPVRGFISADGNGRQMVHFVKTGEGGISSTVLVTSVHTGMDIAQADSIVVMAYPEADISSLQDFIYWRPEAIGRRGSHLRR